MLARKPQSYRWLSGSISLGRVATRTWSRQNEIYWWPRRKGILHASLSCIWGSERKPTASGPFRSYGNFSDAGNASKGSFTNDNTSKESSSRQSTLDNHRNHTDIDSREELDLGWHSEGKSNASLDKIAPLDSDRKDDKNRISPTEDLRDLQDSQVPADIQILDIGSDSLLSPEHAGTTRKYANQDPPEMPSYHQDHEVSRESYQVDMHETPSQNSLTGEEKSGSRTIYMMGVGPVGQFIAYALGGLDPPPPVTLLMHRPPLLQKWRDSEQVLRVIEDGVIRGQTGFTAELSAKSSNPRSEWSGSLDNNKPFFEFSDKVIDNLIITTDAVITVTSLASIKHRLRAHSTICFVQHGAGIVEEVNKHIFPDLQTRPHYMLGNLSHGLFATEYPWTIAHTAPGDMKLTIPEHGTNDSDGELWTFQRKLAKLWAPSSRYMLMSLSRSPQLGAIGMNYGDFMMFHLEFLAVNSVIGPLSVMFDCPNDSLLYNYQASQTMKSLIYEISEVLLHLPELQEVKKLSKRFRPKRLESMVLSVLGRTGNSRSVMLETVRKGMKTDIDFYNGYLAQRAFELGISFTANELVISLVKAKQAMICRERNMFIPMARR